MEGSSAPGTAGSRLPAQVSFWDAELRVRMGCAAFAAFAGRSEADVVGRHAQELLGEALFEHNRPFAERALAGETQVVDRAFTDADGVAHHLQARYVPAVLAGVRGFFAIVTDVTPAPPSAPASAAAVEDVYRRAFLASPVGKVTFDDATRMLEINPALCEMLGYERDELAGTPLTGLFDSEQRPAEAARLAALFAGTLDPVTTEQCVLRRDGSPLWVILSLASADGGPDGAPLGIAQFQDIGARRAAEAALRRSRERLAQAEEIAQMGSWELDVATRRTAWSDGIYRIYGLAPQDTEHDLDRGVRERVHPDDADLLRATIERSLATLTPFIVEYRVRRGDGRIRTLRARGEVIVDASGAATRLVGIVQDVSDARLARDALQRAGADMEHRARELQQLALSGSGEAGRPSRATLTARQLEIVGLVARGMTNGAIARRLFLSEATVKWHLKQVLAKTGAANRAEAVARVLGGDA